MDTTTLVRYTLWASFPFNLLGAYVLGSPSSALGRLAGLPEAVPPIYAAVLAFIVALFGAMFAWIAAQPRIHRPMVAVGAIGKAGVFVIAFAFWLSDGISWRVVLLASGDLAFAAVWIRWLLASRRSSVDERAAG